MIEQKLMAWVEASLKQRQWQCEGELSLSPLSGDAGFRCYYRLNTQPPLLAVYAPPTTEDSEAFTAIAEYLRDQGVHTPEVVALDAEQGFLLVEDLGDDLFLPALSRDNVETLYGEALMTLLRMQQSPANHTLLPAYDGCRLRQEMELFREWFVPQLLGYQLSPEENDLIDEVFTLLEHEALAQPQVLVHRDYHSRNLLLREGGAPGVVDFQDAVWGPMTYDLVSLLRDCYIRWPQADVERWALAYGKMAEDVGLLSELQPQSFVRWFDWMGLQRHIKVLGIFSRLWLRDHKSGYLDDLPLVIRYTLEVAEKYPELGAFVNWFKQELLPIVETQSWYSDYRVAGDGVSKESNT